MGVDFCSSYEYNFYNEKAFCYFWERFLTDEDACPCEYANIVDGSLEESYDNPLTLSIFEEDDEN